MKEWTDVSFAKRQLCVERNDWRGQVSSTKGGRLRYVPLTQRLAATLQAHRHLNSPRVLCDAQGHPLAEHHVTDLLQRASRVANLENNGRTFCGTRSVPTSRCAAHRPARSRTSPDTVTSPPRNGTCT
jgi:integrase